MNRAPDTLEPAYDWRRRAACTAADVDPGIFYPVGQGPRALDDQDKAKVTCARCPVKAACLQHALTAPEEHGIWGGFDEVERRGLRSRPGRHGGARHLMPCGTTAAYRRHIRRGEPVDEPCAQASRLDGAQRKAAARKAAAEQVAA